MLLSALSVFDNSIKLQCIRIIKKHTVTIAISVKTELVLNCCVVKQFLTLAEPFSISGK